MSEPEAEVPKLWLDEAVLVAVVRGPASGPIDVLMRDEPRPMSVRVKPGQVWTFRRPGLTDDQLLDQLFRFGIERSRS